MFKSKNLFKVIITILFLATSMISYPVFSFNMAYVGVNSNYLGNVACYVRSDNQQPFFGVTSIFAANINGHDPNAPELFFNTHVETVLQSPQIKQLQQQGIKVLMTLLGNHDNAGWSCMTDETAIQAFANDVVAMTNQYQLDGVDIDDEYSTCQPNNYSLIRIAQAIKANPDFKGKLLTKALYMDSQYFKTIYQGHRLADFLDFAWEMTYSSDQFAKRLEVYLQNGMTDNQLMLGGWTANSYPEPYQLGRYTTQHNLAGTMIFDVTNTSQSYITQILQGQLANKEVSIDVTPNCLQSHPRTILQIEQRVQNETGN